MKTIKIYKVTSYALEILRMVLEIKTGQRVRFGEHDLCITNEQRHTSTTSDWKWQTKTQEFRGDVYVVLPETQLLVPFGHLKAKIELSSISSSWRAHRVSMKNRTEGGEERYVAYCEYKPDELRTFEDVIYPMLIRTCDGTPS